MVKKLSIVSTSASPTGGVAAPFPRAKREKERKTISFASRGGNKIYFISLGCPRNLVDSEVMLGILLKAGYEVADQLVAADYLVVNTCGFLEASRQESIETIDQALKQAKKGAKLIVAGCMVRSHKEALKEQFPEIASFLGSGDVENILKVVQGAEGENISSTRSYLEVGEVPRQISTPHHYAYLKIAEGCRKRCSYCIIPDIKGPLKSKSQEQILKECRLLLGQGVKEIILIAQDLGDYGRDLGFSRVDGLTEILKKILREVEGDYWLRLMYLYPDEITPELIALIKNEARICPYIDMPIQHIDPEILRAMRRTTSAEQIRTTLEMLRREIPEIVIRTSLIVGFPGETEAQFQALLQFVQEHPLDYVGVFQFSREQGAHAYDLPHQIEEAVKEERYHRLMQQLKEVGKNRWQRMKGKTLSVVVEGYHPDSPLLMVGRYQGQAPEIDGMIILNQGSEEVLAFGERYPVLITDSLEYDLIGSIAARRKH